MFTLYNVCSVNWGIFSTSGMFSTSGDIIMNVGDTMCTSGDVQYIGGEGYHEYIGGGGRDIMSTLGDVQHIRGIS